MIVCNHLAPASMTFDGDVTPDSAIGQAKIVKLKHQFFERLAGNNYFIWKAQVITFLRGYGLLPYVTGEISIDSDEGKIQQDQLIIGRIFSTLQVDILAQVASATTSAKAWERLWQIHVSTSGSRILQLRQQLQKVKKRDLAMKTFISKVVGIVDCLRTVGVTVADSKIVLYVLSGLDTDYEVIVAVISSQLESMMLPTMRILLTNQEIRNTNNRSLIAEMGEVNMVKHRGDKGNHPVCQICAKKGHVALACHNLEMKTTIQRHWNIGLVNYKTRRKNQLTQYGHRE